ncbi:MAG: dihydrolipoamide acetyltransferase family protein [Bacteroidetes bacterium]|nr:dihydrolipoamide acetyltransferase family protein [Bacteroidota bacterium]
MPIAIEMPKMTDTMEEGVLVEWSVEEGDSIAAGDVIAQVETDKATMDVEAYDDGVLLKKVANAGDALPIGGLIAIIGDAGEDITDFIEDFKSNGTMSPAPSESSSEVSVKSSPDQTPTLPEDEPSSHGRTKASPLARRMATEFGLKLNHLTGSGPSGRIIKRDIEAEIERTPQIGHAPLPVPTSADRGHERVRISQMRKTIARRLAESKFTSPHFYLNVDVDVVALDMQRRGVNQYLEKTNGLKVSFNDFITKACASALVMHPDVNVTYASQEGEIHKYNYVDVGIAVAIDDGLVTPVIRDAHLKSVVMISQEVQSLASRARDKQLDVSEMEGSTFTTSNLGMFGIESFTAIINPPNACILAIGAIRDTPVVEDGKIVPGKRMKLTLSCDHRAVDGAVGARFMSTLKDLLENPASLLL